MPVVKQGGNVPLPWKAEVQCKGDGVGRENDGYGAILEVEKNDGCGAILEVEEKDLVLRYWLGTHFQHFYAAVKCPACGKYTRVTTPDNVWERMNTTKNRRKATPNGVDESL